MFLKQVKQKNGRINISFVQGYKDPVTKITKHKVIERLGFVDEYKHLYEDPIAHFKEVARRRTKEMQEGERKKEIHLGIVYSDELMDENENSMRYLGLLPLSFIYHELKLNQFIINRQRSKRLSYSLNDIMQLLVYTRILSPGSKRYSYEQKDKLVGSYNCKEHDVYRALDHFDGFASDLLLHLHEQVRINYKRQTQVVFYDVTNYYFEIDKEDEFRKKGFCKHNTRNPLVQMGLLLDSDAIPITYHLFEGNTHDSQSMMPLLQETRKDYGLGRIITVADKALNSGDNVAFLMAKGDGFIFSQKIKGADQELQKFVFNQEGYVKVKGVVDQVDTDDGREDPSVFLMKSRLYPQRFWVTHMGKSKRRIPLDVKQVVCYNGLYARRQRFKRAEVLEKAKRIVANPGRYNKRDVSGALRYVRDIEFDPETGECLNSKKIPYLDLKKIAEDEKYDGYYAIITSEVDMPDKEVVENYHGLWEIERSFRITKSDLCTRPVHLSLKTRINAHFLTCYISLLVLRLLSKRLEEYSPEQIIKSLRCYQACFIKDNVFKITYYDRVIQAIGSALNLPLGRRFLTVGDIKQLVADSKKGI